jgi:hypothetical protein
MGLKNLKMLFWKEGIGIIGTAKGKGIGQI